MKSGEEKSKENKGEEARMKAGSRPSDVGVYPLTTEQGHVEASLTRVFILSTLRRRRRIAQKK